MLYELRCSDILDASFTALWECGIVELLQIGGETLYKGIVSRKSRPFFIMYDFAFHRIRNTLTLKNCYDSVADSKYNISVLDLALRFCQDPTLR